MAIVFAYFISFHYVTYLLQICVLVLNTVFDSVDNVSDR